MRRRRAALGAVAAAAVLWTAGVMADDAPAAAGGSAVFSSHCAVCHGAQAGGIPGSFPSLHGQIVHFSKIPAGRDYLVMVVTTGLFGPLSIDGVAYNGAMPAQGALSEADIASVLNYLASDLGKKDLGDTAFSAAEVAHIRAQHADHSAQATRALRPAVE